MNDEVVIHYYIQFYFRSDRRFSLVFKNCLFNNKYDLICETSKKIIFIDINQLYLFLNIYNLLFKKSDSDDLIKIRSIGLKQNKNDSPVSTIWLPSKKHIFKYEIYDYTYTINRSTTNALKLENSLEKFINEIKELELNKFLQQYEGNNYYSLLYSCASERINYEILLNKRKTFLKFQKNAVEFFNQNNY